MLLCLHYRKIKQIIRSTNIQVVQLLSEQADNSTDTKAIAKEILQSDVTRSTSLIDHEHEMPDDSKEVAKDIVKAYPEEPTNCCMTGCANCVWLDYAEQISNYYKDGGEKAEEEIMNKVNDSNIRAFLLFELRMRHGQS